jgi:hypothetical protein
VKVKGVPGRRLVPLLLEHHPEVHLTTISNVERDSFAAKTLPFSGDIADPPAGRYITLAFQHHSC